MSISWTPFPSRLNFLLTSVSLVCLSTRAFLALVLLSLKNAVHNPLVLQFFFWHLLSPRKLICVDKAKNSPFLQDYIDQRALGDRFCTNYGVDQADKPALEAILQRDIPGEAVDLIVDDASHLYPQTRATLETLFPKLRNEGLYILEDWKALPEEISYATETDKQGPALRQLVHECQALCESRPDIISSVTINQYFAAIKRGPAPTESCRDALEQMRLRS